MGYSVKRGSEGAVRVDAASEVEAARKYGARLGFNGQITVGPEPMTYRVQHRAYSDPLVLKVWSTRSVKAAPEGQAREALLSYIAGTGLYGGAAAEYPLFTSRRARHRPGGLGYTQTGRADLAVFAPDHTHGYEIKTQTDSLTRLPKQWPEYVAGFDRASFVLAPRHFDRAARILPETVGLLLLEGGTVKPQRTARPGPRPDPIRYLLGLWRVELEGIASGYLDMKKTALKKADMFTLAYALSRQVEYGDLIKEVRVKRLGRKEGKREAWRLPSLS